MPDLEELLSHQAEQLNPGPPPPFSKLQNRARRRHRAKTIGGWGVSVAVVTAIAVGVPQVLGNSHQQGQPLPVGQPNVAASNDPSFQSAAAIAATKLSNLGATDPGFSTVVVDSQRQALIVYRKGGAPSSIYPSSIDGIPVGFDSALLSANEISRTIDAISAARDKLAGVGITLTSVTASVGGPVQVHVQNPSSAMVAKVAAYAPYGASSIQIAGPETVMPAPLPHVANSLPHVANSVSAS
jgi:hypothetical protein